jgi:nitrogen-specific signal transduction histidine kinase
VTAQRETEEALRQARDELARVNAELEQKVQQRTARLRETVAELEGFSYSITHDMRAPLRAMNGYAEMLEAEFGRIPSTDALEYLRRIKVAANRMDQLIQDSLNYSKLVREHLPLGPVDLGNLLRGMVETYPNLQPPEVEISVQFTELFVLGNESALTQVLFKFAWKRRQVCGVGQEAQGESMGRTRHRLGNRSRRRTQRPTWKAGRPKVGQDLGGRQWNRNSPRGPGSNLRNVPTTASGGRLCRHRYWPGVGPKGRSAHGRPCRR